MGVRGLIVGVCAASVAGLGAAGLARQAEQPEAVAVFAGGCFWGVEAVFEHVKGVNDVVSGFAGGRSNDPTYQEVSTGKTGYAESVRIAYDPGKITYDTLLEIFFTVAHDPTQLNRQGPDVGPQYRSAIFFANADQERAARAYIARLERDQVFKKPIVTEVAPLDQFRAAEAYHQDFAARNPNLPYIVVNDRPKIARLKERFPKLYRAEP